MPVEFSIIRKYIHITIGPGPTTEMKKLCGDGEEDKIMGWFGTVYFADQQLILKSRGSQF